MKRIVSFISVTIFLLSNNLAVYGQSDFVDRASKLKNYKQARPIEKVYLHFDKPYYAAGDTMYFKAYVTYAEQYRLSGLSGVLHVNLINTAGIIEQSIKLKLNNGIAWGDFALPGT